MPRPRHLLGPVNTPFRRVDVTLAPGTARALAELARQHGLQLKHLALAIHCRVLSAVCAQSEIVTGLVTNVRPEVDDGDRVLGLFINTVPFRVACQGTWIDLARACYQRELESFEHRFCPLSAIQQEVGAAPFETFFNFAQFETARAAGVPVIEKVEGTVVDVDFCLAVDFELIDGALQVYLQYRTSDLSPEQVDALAQVYERAIALALHEPLAECVDAALIDGQWSPLGIQEGVNGRQHADAPAPRHCSAIAEVWAEVLGLERVELDDDFPELGGHSLLRVQIAARLREQLGLSLPLQELMQCDTVRLQAEVVERASTRGQLTGAAIADGRKGAGL